MAAADIRVAVLHGAGPTYTIVNDEAGPVIANPTTVPTTTPSDGVANGLPIGTYTLSYTLAGASGETLPLAPITFNLGVPATDGWEIEVETPASLPTGATEFRWYFSSAANGGLRRFLIANGTSVTFQITTLGTGDLEPSVNSTTPDGLTFGRSDDESGAIPIPIPQAGPASVYSYYKALQLYIPAGGEGTTTISNLSVFKSENEPSGLLLFWRAVNSYVQCNGVPGVASGNYPAADYSPRSGTAPNVPPAYLPVFVNGQTYDSGSHATSSDGGIGKVLQLVMGVTDKSSFNSATGILDLPDIILQFDES